MRPEDFWQLSPTEWHWLQPEDVRPLSRSALDQLCHTYPDTDL